VRSLLKALSKRIAKVTVLDSKRNIEHEAEFERPNGYDSLTVRITAT
jgi:hypothetical protein